MLAYPLVNRETVGKIARVGAIDDIFEVLELRFLIGRGNRSLQVSEDGRSFLSSAVTGKKVPL